jgi:hypothetical protein
MAVEPTIRLGPDHADGSPDSNGGFREPDLDIDMATMGSVAVMVIIRAVPATLSSTAELEPASGPIRASLAGCGYIGADCPFPAPPGRRCHFDVAASTSRLSPLTDPIRMSVAVGRFEDAEVA